jgi:hypothetical protein
MLGCVGECCIWPKYYVWGRAGALRWRSKDPCYPPGVRSWPGNLAGWRARSRLIILSVLVAVWRLKTVGDHHRQHTRFMDNELALSWWHLQVSNMSDVHRYRPPAVHSHWQSDTKVEFLFTYFYQYSATKFILYTAGGSIFLLIGVLSMGLHGSNEPGWDLERLINQSYPAALEILLYFYFLIAYAVKLLIMPLHSSVARINWSPRPISCYSAKQC